MGLREEWLGLLDGIDAIKLGVESHYSGLVAFSAGHHTESSHPVQEPL